MQVRPQRYFWAGCAPQPRPNRAELLKQLAAAEKRIGELTADLYAAATVAAAADVAQLLEDLLDRDETVTLYADSVESENCSISHQPDIPIRAVITGNGRHHQAATLEAALRKALGMRKTKICNGPVCRGQVLPVEEFGRNRSQVDGLHRVCKVCERDRQARNVAPVRRQRRYKERLQRCAS